MENTKKIQNVSKATIGRLPAYHRYLKEKLAAGETSVSSTAVAEELHLNAVQVRKDLAVISSVAANQSGGSGLRISSRTSTAYSATTT